MVRRIVQLVAFLVIWSILGFASAGTFDGLRAWIYLALLAGGFTVAAVVVFKSNPHVIAERGKLHADTNFFGKITIAIYTLLLFTTPVIAGFDAVRFRWSSMPFASVYVGAVLYVVSLIPSGWAMAVNPYLETGVRLQQNRGQRVFTSGPYRFVRHPMYVGVILNQFAAPQVLGSRSHQRLPSLSFSSCGRLSRIEPC